ncbi:uncharacterized protein LOC128281820 [Gossypium arboreum]|uniref:uncharacterized protein LOC128281820 n=1 Tax=Gossypium arboreum TaxID=29729 RepID=UPI0022F1D323|nr:uncharacterized protein LOC128281820 [Gossypium arboreum]
MSDHCPLLLNTDIGSNYMGRSNFKFEAWWTIEESLEREIKTTWESSTEKDDDTMVKIIDTRVHLNMEIDKDDMYWEQRARASWLKLRDKNSSFFHKYASTRRCRNTISRLEFDEEA